MWSNHTAFGGDGSDRARRRDDLVTVDLETWILVNTRPIFPAPVMCPRCDSTLGSCQHHALAAAYSRAWGLFGTRDLEFHVTSQTWIPAR